MGAHGGGLRQNPACGEIAMNLKTFWIAAAVLSLAAFIALGLALGSTDRLQRDLIALEKRRTDHLLLAERLRRNSEDLTRMARHFAVTGDARYEDLYRRIAAVRDGKLPRPPGDSPAYWDLLLTEATPPKGEGERVALAEEVAQAKLPAAEQALLARSRASHEVLARLEARAMAAMKGEGPDATPQSPGAPDPVQALKILYGSEYLEAKGRALQALAELHAEIEVRTRGELVNAHQALARALQLIWVVLAGFALAGIVALLAGLRRGLLPLLALRRHGEALIKGDYVQRSKIRALPEIVALGKALNEASSRLEAGARELAERERYLEALLRTSPLGLALVDARNRIRWTSRRLRDFLGDAKQDLKQLPFDQLFADPGELAAFRDTLERKGRVREHLVRIRRRDGTEFRARLDAAHVDLSAERLAAVWLQAFGLHGQPAATEPGES
jgi:PAS domain S-box-containing protein